MIHFKLISFLAVFLLLLIGCANPFAPAEITGESTSNLLTDQEDPDGVLINFKYAYTFKDSLVYSDLFDSTFVFLSLDFNVAPPIPIQWGRDVELRTAGRMFDFFNTLDLTFNVKKRDTLTLDESNKPVKIQDIITFTLTFDGGASIPTLNGEVEYTYIFRDPKWLISQWEDLQI